jgi:hypothetical protein
MPTRQASPAVGNDNYSCALTTTTSAHVGHSTPSTSKRRHDGTRHGVQREVDVDKRFGRGHRAYSDDSRRASDASEALEVDRVEAQAADHDEADRRRAQGRAVGAEGRVAVVGDVGADPGESANADIVETWTGEPMKRAAGRFGWRLLIDPLTLAVTSPAARFREDSRSHWAGSGRRAARGGTGSGEGGEGHPRTGFAGGDER